MGWTYSSAWTTKSKLVADLLADYQRMGYQVIDHATTKSGLWAVIKPENGTAIITLALIERSRGEYGYKDMDESASPYYYDCPLAFLDLAPASKLEWRSRVRAFHQDRAGGRALLKALYPGLTLRLRGKAIPQITVVEVKGRTVTGEYGGTLYKITPKSLVGAEVVEP